MLPKPSWPGDVVTIYRDAGARWLRGEDLYNDTGTGFIYLPQSALLSAPLAVLSYEWAGALWRAINIGVFAFGVLRLARLAAPSSTMAFSIIVTSIAALLSWSAARHGQMTLVMGGLMMSAVADLRSRRFWSASLALAFAVAFKPLAIVLVLLTAVLYPRTSWRLALVFVGIALAPFAFQSIDYVLSQYRAVPDMFRDAAENGLETPYAEVFWSLRAVGLETSPSTQRIVRLVAALGTLAICAFTVRRARPSDAAVYLYTFASAYILLLSPRTERNTYALIAPAFGIFTARAFADRRWATAGFRVALVLVFLAGHPVADALFGRSTVWWKPVLCVVFLVDVLREWRRAVRAWADASPTDEREPSRARATRELPSL